MKKAISLYLLSIPTVIIAFMAQPSYALSDNQIKQAIIQESLSNYSGNCPCPYNKDRAGRSCGRRSAYSKPGGYSPICYPNDVTPKMVQTYMQSHQDIKPKQ